MILVNLWAQTDCTGGILKIPVIQIYERYDGANKVQIEQLSMLSYLSNSTIFRAKKLETKSAMKKTKRTWKIEWEFTWIYVCYKGEDSWLNATKTKLAFIKGRLNSNSKSATAANVYLIESLLLDSWLTNNHMLQ